MKTGGLTDDMEKDIRDLKDELDEREGMLRKYGEWEDGEDGTVTYRERDSVPESERENYQPDWKAKYDALEQRYIDRFFGRTEDDSEKKSEYIEKEETEDIKRDGTVQTFDDLLYSTQGTDRRDI